MDKIIITNQKKQLKYEPKVLAFSLDILDFICLTLLEFFKCCKCFVNKKIKRKLFLKANDIIDNKLDIVFYLKHMNLLDIINQILKYENKKGIIKFLSTPIIIEEEIIEKKSEIKYSDKYNEHYCDYDLDKLGEEILNMDINENLHKNDKKLMNLVHKKLKMLLE